MQIFTPRDHDGPFVRRATFEDAHVLRALRLRSLREDPQAFASTWAEEAAFGPEVWAARLRQNVEGDRSCAFLAELRGEAVGLTVGVRDDPPTATAYLSAMWVAPDARRHGAARMLVGAVAEWARPRFRYLQLEVTGGNAAAWRLYHASGFVEVERGSVHLPGGPTHSVTIVRDLWD